MTAAFNEQHVQNTWVFC